MVCKTCEKKLSKVAAPDPTRNRALTGSLVASGSKAGSSSVGKAVGGNKLLGAKNRYNPVSTRCKLCKQSISQEGAQYCQGETWIHYFSDIKHLTQCGPYFASQAALTRKGCVHAAASRFSTRRCTSKVSCEVGASSSDNVHRLPAPAAFLSIHGRWPSR